MNRIENDINKETENRPPAPDGKRGRKKARDNFDKHRFRILPKKAIHGILLILDLLVTAYFLVMMTLVDAFPKALVLVILVLLVLLLVLIWRLLSSNKKHTRRRILGVILSIV